MLIDTDRYHGFPVQGATKEHSRGDAGVTLRVGLCNRLNATTTRAVTQFLRLRNGRAGIIVLLFLAAAGLTVSYDKE